LDPLKILIVDDEPDITLTLSKGLERRGYRVEIFNDPLIALSNFKPNAYGLLLLDIKMPNMTGFEFFRKVKDLDPKIRVCFITAFETYYESFEEEFLPLDAVKGFIRKPIETEDLVKFVDSVTK
jgi:two-component system, OmpR family, response regulator ChvI